jgi:asparagine synthase (glutamine-hydrolysing)
MCGIAGWLGDVQIPASVCDDVLGTLRQRGPDGSGIERWPHGCLMHTRLRIIDLSPAGRQPMASEDGSVWTMLNGEIYNHHDLRAEVEARGHKFHGRCDAEVLPHLYEEHGVDLFSRLRGMYAIAIFDRDRRRLLLGRDRFGIKPIFYAHGPDFLAFASRIESLRIFPGVDLEPDAQAVADFTSLLFVPAPQTIHRGIRSLEPGELLDCTLEPDGRVAVTTRRYHAFQIATDTGLTLDDAVDRTDELVRRAVGRQLESDVTLGALLSGGIDSSLISYYARQEAKDALLTFNVRMPDPRYDETEASTAVASAIGSRHTTLGLAAGSGSWDQVTSLLRYAGQPFADSSLFAVNALSQAMRPHVTVALSGDGGDEGFGGYNLYWRLSRAVRLRTLPPRVWRLAGSLATPLAGAGIVRRSLPRSLREAAGGDETGLLQSLFSWLPERERNRVLLDAGAVAPTRRLFEPQWTHVLPSAASTLERLGARAVEINLRLVLPNDYLFKVDTASMRESLEVRVPMLDEDLVDFALTLPYSLRVRGRIGKLVLRGVASRHLPASVVGRKKQGFSVPVDEWVADDVRDGLRDRLLVPGARLAQFLDRNVYEPWVTAFCARQDARLLPRADLYQRVLMLLALELSLDTRNA